MKKVKKVLVLSLVACMVLGFAACSGNGDVMQGTSPEPPPADNTATPTPSGMTPEEIRAIVDKVAAESDWGEMAFESGIIDTIDEIIEIDGNYTFRVGCTQGGRSDGTFVLELLQAYIEGSTAGKVRVEVYPLSQLGTNAQALEGVLDGSITAWVSPLDQLYNYAPGIGVTSIPFFFDKGAYQAVNIFRQDPTMEEYLKAQGFWPVSWAYINSNNIISTKKFETINDFSGAKIWVHPTENWQMMASSFGATPVVLDSSEIAMSFQTGAIDACSAGISFFDGFKIQETAGYMHDFPFGAAPFVLSFGVEYMNSLPENLRNLIIKAGRLIPDFQHEFNVELLKGAEASVSQDAEIVRASDELQDEMKSRTAHIADAYIEKGEENAKLYETFKGLIDSYNAANGERGLW